MESAFPMTNKQEDNILIIKKLALLLTTMDLKRLLDGVL